MGLIGSFKRNKERPNLLSPSTGARYPTATIPKSLKRAASDCVIFLAGTSGNPGCSYEERWPPGIVCREAKEKLHDSPAAIGDALILLARRCGLKTTKVDNN